MTRSLPRLVLLGLLAPAVAAPRAATATPDQRPERTERPKYASGPTRATGATSAGGTIPAELALGEAQLVLAPGSAWDWTDEDPAVSPLRAAGFVQLVGGGEGGADLGAGAAVALSGLGCDLVYGIAQGRLRPFADAPVIGDAQGSLCLLRYGMTAILEGHVGAGLAPALGARRSLWRRRYDLSYSRVTVGGGELGHGHHHHSMILVSVGTGTTRQADGADQRKIDQLDIAVVAYRDRYAARGIEAQLDVVAFGVDAMKASGTNLGGVASAFEPLRASVDAGPWFASARAGWGITGGTVTASSTTSVNGEEVSSWSETIDGEGLPELVQLVGEFTAGVRRERSELSAGVSRSFYPTFDGNLALEERASANLAYRLGRERPTTLRLSPFAARTWTWTRDAGSSYEVSAGASLAAGRALPHRLRVDAIGEAGVTPYARLDGARDPSSRLGGRLLVALSAGAGL